MNYFSKLKHRAQLCSAVIHRRRAELEARYRQSYHELARYLYHQDNQDPLPTRAIAVRELPNLRRAPNLMLASPYVGGTEGGLDTAADLRTASPNS